MYTWPLNQHNVLWCHIWVTLVFPNTTDPQWDPQCVHIHSYPDERTVPSLVPRPSLPPVVELDRAWVQGWYSHQTLLLLSCVPDRVWEWDGGSENETEGLRMRQRVWERDRGSENETEGLGMRQEVWEWDYLSTSKVRSKKVHSKVDLKKSSGISSKNRCLFPMGTLHI